VLTLPNRNKQAALVVLLLLCALPSLAQKKASPSGQRKTAPKAIRFQGAPQYSQDELLAAAGLKPDTRLGPSEVKAHAKQLSDTGFFEVVKFSTDSKGLVFTLTPSKELYPLHIENFPLKPGKELIDKLHEHFPLFHDQLPGTGSVVDGISRTLEEMLAAKGIKATVASALTSGLGPNKITALNFSITSPPVKIGAIQFSGVSAAMQAKVSSLTSSQTGNPFDTENTAIGLQHAFESLYQDIGDVAVKVDVTQGEAPIVSAQSVDIPFAVAVNEGGVYKLGSINYPSDALVTRTEVQKALAKYPAASGRPIDQFLLATSDAYHARGYLDCSVDSRPAFNEATHIVNYGIEITPGKEYRMGTVQFDGAPDAMIAKLKNAWKLAPGAVFDESYVSGFAARAQKQDKSLAKWMQTVLTNYDEKPDPATHQVNCIFHFTKPVQSGH
jgi:outer membrane protein assembly factor BamA